MSGGQGFAPGDVPEQSQEQSLAQALALHQGGDVAAAAARYRQLLDARPDDVQLQFLLATARLQLGDAAGAVGLFERVLIQAPDSAGALVNLGLALQQLGSADQALQRFSQAITVQPSYAEAWFCRANLLSALGRQGEALDDYERAESFRPGYGECLYNHAMLLAALAMYDEALEIYDSAIAAAPDFAAAYNNRSVVLRLLKRLPQALEDCERALALNPADVDALLNRGNVLRDMGQPHEALRCFTEALTGAANFPANALAHCSRGDALKDLGQLPQALAAYDAAIACRPDYAEAYLCRGNLYMEQQNYPCALADYDRVLSFRADFVIAWNNRGNALWKLKRLEEAEASFSRALALQPEFAESHNNRACVLKDMALFYQDGKLVEHGDGVLRSNAQHNRALLEAALAACDSALAFRPSYAEACLNRGHILTELNRSGDALEAYDRALALDPSFAEAHCGRANVLTDCGRAGEALAAYDRAIMLKPAYGEAHNNRGNLLKHMRDFPAARASFTRALALEPDNPSMRWNLALLELAAGNYPQGWALYESRWQREVFVKARRNFAAPQWTGAEDIRGRRLLIHAEQGFGDTVQFCRYVPMVVARGAQVFFEVPPPLLPLLRSLNGPVTLLRRGDALPDFDLHCPLMSLPRAFGTVATDIPAAPSYLRADPSRTAHWQRLLGEKIRPRIGLVVSGKPEHANDHNRSLALSAFADLLRLPFDFHLLQRDLRSRDEPARAAAPNLHDHRAALTDFGETAALVACMDSVISVDTSVAHIAGALGVPLHLLLPYAVDWRWFLEGTRTPWYPCAQLYRQPADGDWKTPLLALINRFAGSSAGRGTGNG